MLLADLVTKPLNFGYKMVTKPPTFRSGIKKRLSAETGRTKKQALLEKPNK